jgi:hypothetical protein
MLKIRLQGTTRDIKWFLRLLRQDTRFFMIDPSVPMDIKGNIIPANWYKTILRENGKPYLLAICILSELWRKFLH